MIKLKNYAFAYDDKEVFNNLDLKLPKGQKIALLGSNASGKSTLLRILAGLYFGKGEYFFNSNLVNKKSIKNLRAEIGILFQNPDSMIFNPTVFDEIAFGLKQFGFSDIEDRVLTIANEFKITHLLKKSPLNLSGGQKQKVMLSAVLAYEPKLLLLDEPTSALDPKSSGWLIDFLIDLDITTLIATHDLSFAYEIADIGVVLNSLHKISYKGDLEKLMRNLDTLQEANLIHKHKHKHKNFMHSHYHLHF